MTVLEQNIIKEKAYKEANRYMDNVKDYLKQAKKEGKYYQDDKYVKTACGVAYSAVLLVLDCIFQLNNIPEPKNRKDISHYRENITKINKKLLTHLNHAYKLLHLSGYYDGVTKVIDIQSGLEEALSIINVIKPHHKN